MFVWGWWERLRYGARQALGLAWVAACLEIVGIAASTRLPLSPVEWLALSGLNALLLSVWAVCVALVVGLVVHRLGAQRRPADGIALQLGLTTTLLCGWYLWPAAYELATTQRLLFALFVGTSPLGFGVVLQLNARYWLRRVELELKTPISWLMASAALSAAVCLGVAGVTTLRDTGGRGALEGDPNAVVLVVDGLPAKSLAEAFPTLASLGAQGRLYTQGVSPAPAAAPTVASVLTGLHPLRASLAVDGQRLPRGLTTLAEELDEEGFATAAFVSSPVLQGSLGFEQGFRVYDDAVPSMSPGFSRLSVARRLLPDLARERPASSTVDAFAAWLPHHAQWPLFALIHLAADEPRVSGADARDAQIERVLEELERAEVLSKTLVVVVGSSGVAGQGLRDAAVLSPMVIRAPGAPAVGPLDLVVEPMDVRPTVRGWLGLDKYLKVEGLDLLRPEPIPQRVVTLVGEDVSGEPAVGVRSPQVKYVRVLTTGSERLYDLEEDPSEQRDIAASQDRSRSQAADAVEADARTFERLLKESL